MRRRSVSAQELAYYRAHFLEALREDGVVCLECGTLYKFLGRHVHRHGMTLDDYRANQIAARIGITVATVNYRLRRLGARGVPVPAPVGPRPSGMRRVTDERILELAQELLRPTEIAARVGISPASLRERLQRLRRRGLLPPAAPSGSDATAQGPA